MVEGRRRDAWNHTANLLAKIHNVNCVDEDSLTLPIDFHPYYSEEEVIEAKEAAEEERRANMPVGSVAALATLIVGSEPPAET